MEGSMNEWRQRLNEVIAKMERERDELRLQLHLAKAEARDELARVDEKMAELKARAAVIDDEARDALDDIGGAARALADEVRAGYERVRKLL
jgi:predicted  nucleic acid-binding Zn-ribbon protein